MTVSGPPPNPQRARRNADTFGGFRVLKDDGVLRGPELPEYTPDAQPWHEKTLIFWHQWRTSPLSQLFRDTDWDIMQRAALIHHQIWTTRTWAKFTDLSSLNKELDRILGNYGATYGDRLKLRILIEDIDPEGDVKAVKGDPQDPFYEDLFGE